MSGDVKKLERDNDINDRSKPALGVCLVLSPAGTN